MQIQVRQQGRGYPALRRPFLRPAPLTASALSLIPLHYGRFQPHPDQLQDRAVHHPHAYACQKLGVRYRIKIAFQVRVIHRLIPGLQMAAYLLQRLVRRAPRSEPIRSIQEIRLKDRFQDLQGRHLHYPVAYRRNSQRPQFPVRLRNVDALHCLRLIGLRAQRFLDSFQKPRYALV